MRSKAQELNTLRVSTCWDAPVVLVAEDEVLIRLALSDSLANHGCKVLEAASAEEAIDVLESEPAIDVVFSDIRMPGDMNGIDLARWIRAHRPELEVVLTSGDTKKTELADDLDPDARFIEKPYNIESVVDRLYRLAQRSRQ